MKGGHSSKSSVFDPENSTRYELRARRRKTARIAGTVQFRDGAAMHRLAGCE
ncbi:hypothetical protein BRPE64_ACDS09890 [Caballeronia insecticola]|uniref:Uncharacterized protein n=1 Tax=Caballeronia insecticola TaxID=758793 RepID=R4WG25_9BURK|nr:hypothetical protein BRPE64_ACDS09890 [Caballeronia insecticola]